MSFHHWDSKERQKRFFVLGYYPPPSTFRRREIGSVASRLESLAPALELTPILTSHGYEYGGIIAALPEPVRLKMPSAFTKSRTEVSAGDLVLLTKRPPLDDHLETRPQKYTVRSNLPIEQEILGTLESVELEDGMLRPVLAVCDAERLILSARVDLPQHAREFEAVFFNQNRIARVKAWGRRLERRTRPPEPRPALGYLISVPRSGPAGFDCITMFGIDELTSLVFAQLLRTVWEGVMSKVLTNLEASIGCVLIARFLPPEEIPLPILAFDPEKLDAKIVANVFTAGKCQYAGTLATRSTR